MAEEKMYTKAEVEQLIQPIAQRLGQELAATILEEFGKAIMSAQINAPNDASRATAEDVRRQIAKSAMDSSQKLRDAIAASGAGADSLTKV